MIVIILGQRFCYRRQGAIGILIGVQLDNALDRNPQPLAQDFKGLDRCVGFHVGNFGAEE